MTTSRSAGKKQAPRRKPLWRRLNRHAVFVLHVVLYVIGGIWIWMLNASALDKQFDVLLWLTVLCAHGIAVYRNRRVAFLFHLLMFCAGNGAIWTTTAPAPDKISVTLAWVLVAGGVGVLLSRRQLGGRAQPAKPEKKKARPKKAAPPPEPEWYEPPAETDWYEAPESDEQGYDVEYEEPPPKKRGRKSGNA